MFDKILIPIDMDDLDTSRRAVDVAISLARSNNSELHVLTVLPDYGLSMVGSFFPEGFEKKVTNEFGEKMRDFVGKSFPEELKVRAHIVHGTIYAEVLRVADELNCDVIVMASHRPELQDYLLGPNAARVVRHAKQSVFVVRNNSGQS